MISSEIDVQPLNTADDACKSVPGAPVRHVIVFVVQEQQIATLARPRAAFLASLACLEPTVAN